MENPKSRSEAILQNMLGEDNPLVPPKSRVEALLLALLNGGGGSLITIDTVVTEGSTNPVQNGAIWSFVNSSIATETAHYIGEFNSVAALEAYSGPVTNNDYAIVITTDAAGNTVYNRYKYNGDAEQWLFEYALNNSSFTANQWATINSGLVAADKAKLTNLANIAEISGTATSTGSLTYTLSLTSDDLTKLQGVRDGIYSGILLTLTVDTTKVSMILRRAGTSGYDEFFGISVSEYASTKITLYQATGLLGSAPNQHLLIQKLEFSGDYTLPPATTSNLGGVKVGDGLNVAADGTLKTALVGEILSETAYEALATKDKDIYFTYD